eukprot:10953616-Lingulodinium_polyedra.AAC.1
MPGPPPPSAVQSTNGSRPISRRCCFAPSLSSPLHCRHTKCGTAVATHSRPRRSMFCSTL